MHTKSMKSGYSAPLLTLTCSILAGCLSYVPPTEGELATLTFRNRSDEPSWGYGFIFDFHEYCENMRMTRFLYRGRSTTETIRAGEPIAFGMHYSLAGDPEDYDACSVIGTFTPENDEDYETIITGDADECSLRTFVMRGNQRVKVDVVIRTRLRVTGKGRNRHCEPKSTQ